MAEVQDSPDQNLRAIPSRYLYMIALLDCLRDLGPTNPQGVYDWLTIQGIARQEDRDALQRDGGSRFHKEVRFARQELFSVGLIQREINGGWGLTAAGAATFLNVAGARAIVSRRHATNPRPPEDDLLTNEGFAPTTGPIPVEWSGTVTRSPRGLCWTYATRFGDTLVWKIGLATNVEQRTVELNRHLPHEVIEHRWRPIMRHPWPDARAAYAMEQRVLIELHDVRTTGERVLCSEEKLRMAWRAALQVLDRQRST